MNFKLVLNSILMLITMVEGDLWKPFSLKLQVMLPIGGEIAPLGDLCLEPINLLLNIVNNRSDILPDYNLVLDIIDDKCLGSVALKEIVPFFSADRVEMDEIPKNLTKPGWYRLPHNHQAIMASAETAYVPPLVVGGLCSGVCTVVARNVQFFDLINVRSVTFSLNLKLKSVCLSVFCGLQFRSFEQSKTLSKLLQNHGNESNY